MSSLDQLLAQAGGTTLKPVASSSTSLDALLKATQVTTPAPVVAQPQSNTLMQYLGIPATPAVAQPTAVSQTTPVVLKPLPTPANSLPGLIENTISGLPTASGIPQAASSAFNEGVEGMNTILSPQGGTVAQGAEAALKVGTGIAGVAFSASAPVSNAISNALTFVGNKLADTTTPGGTSSFGSPTTQPFDTSYLAGYGKDVANVPFDPSTDTATRILTALQNLGGIAMGILGAKAGETPKDVTPAQITEVAQHPEVQAAIKQVEAATKTTPTLSALLEKTKPTETPVAPETAPIEVISPKTQELAPTVNETLIAQEARAKVTTVLKLMGNDLQDINVIGSTATGKLKPNDLDILITPTKSLGELDSTGLNDRIALQKTFEDELKPLFPDKKIHVTLSKYDSTRGAKMSLDEFTAPKAGTSGGFQDKVFHGTERAAPGASDGGNLGPGTYYFKDKGMAANWGKNVHQLDAPAKPMQYASRDAYETDLKKVIQELSGGRSNTPADISDAYLIKAQKELSTRLQGLGYDGINVKSSTGDWGVKFSSPSLPKELEPLKTTRTTQTLKPIEGQPAKAASDINDILAKQGFEKMSLEEQAKYTPITKADQLSKVSELMKNPDDTLQKFINGDIPKDVHPQPLYNALEDFYTKLGDQTSLRALGKSKTAQDLSLAAQTMGAHGFNDNPNSAIANLNRADKTKLGGTKGTKDIVKQARQAKATISKTAARMIDYDKILDTLTC